MSKMYLSQQQILSYQAWAKQKPPMDQQHSSYYSYPRGDSKPRTQPTGYRADWGATQDPAGLDMTRNGSKDSAYYSASTECSDDAYYQKHSPNAMSYTAGSPTFCETEPLPAHQYLQPPYFEASPTLERSDSERGHSSRVTPSSLGWTSDATFLNFYKFVIPKGGEPHFELIEGYWGQYDTPDKVFLDPPQHFRKNEFPCQYPGDCADKIFKRPADLERHYRNVHGPPDQKENFWCDYPPCKARGAFTRKDHFRDHLRDYHKEDIGSVKKGDKNKFDEKKWLKRKDAWVAERKIEIRWWRCPKCLERVQIAESGYDCQTCKHPYDRERAERIEAVRASKLKPSYAAPAASNNFEMGNDDYHYAAATSVVPATTYPANCADCGDTGLIYHRPNEAWETCQTCQPPVEQYYKVDDTWENGDYAHSSRY